MNENIYLNGTETLDNIHMRSLTFGEGVFESFRYKSALPVNIKQHIKRLRSGANLLNLHCPNDNELIDAINESYNNTKITDAYVKICLLSSGSGAFYENSQKTDILAVVKNYHPPKTVFKACINSFRRHSGSPILSIKGTNYIESILSKRQALAQGYDESIILNENGHITEGSVSNIFWYNDNVLYTPSIECGLLPGTMRELVFGIAKEVGVEISEGEYGLSSLLDAEYAFFTNALIGSVPISNVEEHTFNTSSDSYESITYKLIERLHWD